MCEPDTFRKDFICRNLPGLWSHLFLTHLKSPQWKYILFFCLYLQCYHSRKTTETPLHTGVFWHHLFYTLLTLTFVREKPLHPHFTEEENEDQGLDALSDVKALPRGRQHTHPLSPRNAPGAARRYGPDRAWNEDQGLDALSDAKALPRGRQHTHPLSPRNASGAARR